MTNEELLRRILACLERQSFPVLPHSIDLWDMRNIAAYLKQSVDTVRDDKATLPTFSKPIRLPVRSATRAHALYKARDVIAWAKRHAS